MQRMGMVIGLEADKVAEYKKLHAAVWPEILALITECNITNYSIFLKEPENLLFGFWEYVGDDFAADMAKMAANPTSVKRGGPARFARGLVGRCASDGSYLTVRHEPFWAQCASHCRVWPNVRPRSRFRRLRRSRSAAVRAM